MSKALQIVEKAADLIEEKGWCQGFYHSYEGSFCAIGALQQAQEDLGLSPRDYFIAKNKVHQKINRWRLFKIHIITWNDKKNQTKEKVLATLRSIK